MATRSRCAVAESTAVVKSSRSKALRCRLGARERRQADEMRRLAEGKRYPEARRRRVESDESLPHVCGWRVTRASRNLSVGGDDPAVRSSGTRASFAGTPGRAVALPAVFCGSQSAGGRRRASGPGWSNERLSQLRRGASMHPASYDRVNGSASPPRRTRISPGAGSAGSGWAADGKAQRSRREPSGSSGRHGRYRVGSHRASRLRLDNALPKKPRAATA
jgi:hypothetical protein